MSDTNRVTFRGIEESSYGVALTTPTLKTYRITGEDLKLGIETQTSGEILNTRETSDLVTVGASVTGSLIMELSYLSCDDFLRWALQSAAWSSPVTLSGTIYSAASADNSYNRSSGDFTSSFTAGMWLRVSGFATAGNNGYCLVTSVATTKLIVSHLTLTNESAGPTVELESGGYITNGATQTTFQGERVYADVASDLVQYLGLAPQGFSLSIAPKNIVTARFPFLGKDEVQLSSTYGDGSPVAAGTTKPFNGVTHTKSIMENGTALSLTAWTMECNNNLRAREVIATFGPESIGSGDFALTGTATAYYSSKTLAQKMKAGTESSWATRLVDDAGNAMVIWVPRIRFTQSDRNAPQRNQDVIHNLAWTALKSSTYSLTCRIFRWAV